VSAPAGWEALLSAALVGTGRRGAPALGPSTAAVAELGPAEAQLLAAAGVMTARRRAGRIPAAAPRLPEPAAEDPRPACPPGAVAVAELVLSGELPIPGGPMMLVSEWLRGAVRAGCRIPERLVPRFLRLGTDRAELRDDVATLTGPRGQWLAARSEAWAWAAAPPEGHEPAERRFATAPRPERVALLQQLRAEDPAAARALVEQGWARNAAPERAALLGAFAVNLSEDDEPFLEAALDDRSNPVRAAAANLLGRLPGSRRAGRMAERLARLVTFERAAGRSAPVRVSVKRLPPPDAAARRDGISDVGPQGVGVSRWWLTQIVAGTPLDWWTAFLGRDPAGAVGTIAAESPDLLPGLELAVVAQRPADERWAMSLFARRPSAALLGALPPEAAAAMLEAHLASATDTGAATAALLAACPGPWPETLSRTVVGRYRNLRGKAAPEFSAAGGILAERLHPAVLDGFEAWLDALADFAGLRHRVLSLGHALSLRAAISREFP
jgi:hypothetical protein